MAEMKKIDVNISISMIKTLKFSVNNTEEAVKTDRSAFQFNISMASFINAEKKIIGFDVLTDVFTDKEMKNKVAELITRIEYSIINFEDVVNIDNKIIGVADPLMLTLISISLSTARGILAAKIEGTALEGVYLPILNPQNFVQKKLEPNE